MSIIRVAKNKNYTVIHNGFLTDSRLSLKAKGLLAYFLSKPDDWSFYTNEIFKNCKDGKDSISTAIKELISCGYVKRSRKRDEKGKFVRGSEFIVYETPSLIEIDEEEEINMDSPELEEAIKDNSYSEKPNMENPKGKNPNLEMPNEEFPHCETPNSKNPPLLNTKSILNTERELNTEYIQNTNTTPNTEYEPLTNYSINTRGISQKSNKNHIEKNWWSCINSDIYQIYQENSFGKINSIIKELLDSYINKYSKEAVKEAMIEAIKNNKYTLSYVEGILKNRYKRQKELEEKNWGASTSGYEDLILNLDDLWD